MASSTLLLDGQYIRGFYVGRGRTDRPFRKNGDNNTIAITREWRQSERYFQPGAPGKDKDPEVRDAYLISESEPEPTGIGDVIRVHRIFSKVPAQQIVPGSRFVTKPDLPGEFPQVSGNSLIIQPEENVPRWVFYTNKIVTSDSGVPNGNSPTGGTYTVTIGASTTGAIAYNASAATLQTALNGLSSVSARGSLVVTGSYTTGFTITFNAYSAATVDASSLTGTLSYVGASTSVAVTGGVSMSFRIDTLPLNVYAFNGGTFTITVFGQTTAPIAYNATLTDVETALEALSNFGAGGVTSIINYGAGNGYGDATSILRSVGATQIGFTVTFTAPSISTSSGSLTPTGSTATATVGTLSTALTFTGVNIGQRILVSVSHGITALDGIVITQGANYRTLPAGTYSVTTDAIILTASSGLAFSTPTAITAVGSQTGNVYTAGTKLTRVKRVTDYYLPGVSEGITTMDDIPLPDYEGDAASLLAAIFDGDTDINFEVGELEYYRDGPILQRTRTTLDASQL